MSGSATDPGDRSSADIEREVESTRARLTGTLEELRDRASPGQLFEQALDYARDSGGADFARNLGQSLRDNPLPIVLIGAGIGWLMLSGNRTQGTTSIPAPAMTTRGGGATPAALPAPSSSQRPVSYGRTGSGGGRSIAERASDAAVEAKNRIGEAASGLGEMAGSARGSVADAASSAADTVSDTAAAVGQRIAVVGDQARDRLGDMGSSAGQGIGWLMREQPLVLGAIGVAIGAAVGALLPGTEAEDRLMGQTRDELAGQATAVAQQGYERVKETAGDAYGKVKDRLDNSGLSTEGVKEALGGVAQEARQAVRDVTQDVAGEARGAIGSGGDAAPARPDQPRPAGTSAAHPVPDPVRPGPV